MNGLQKVQAAIKKFLSLVIPPAEPEPDAKAPPKPHFVLTATHNLSKSEGDKMAEAVRQELERQTGQALTVIHLGSVPCVCDQCRRQRAAQWN